MKSIDFRTALADYLALRSDMGFKINTCKSVLEKLADYLDKHSRGTNIRAELIIDWACNSSSRASGAGKYGRFVLARGFLAYLKSRFPEIEIPDGGLVRAPRRKTPFSFSGSELVQLLIVTQKLGDNSQWSIQPYTAETIFSLMACTGLRPGEALRLKVSDVLLDANPPRLLIRDSKFYKTRWVPMHQSAVAHLRSYVAWRGQTISDCDSFFVTRNSTPLQYQALRRLFLHLIALTGIGSHSGQLPPSLNSFRHTFAMNRIKIWYSDGVDVKGLLPTLSVYLGHVYIDGTYWYLTATPELMATVANRFEDFADKGGAL